MHCRWRQLQYEGRGRKGAQNQGNRAGLEADFAVDAQCAELIARLMPALRSLKIRGVCGQDGALDGPVEGAGGSASAWSALTLACSRLTALTFTAFVPSRIWPRPNWPAMRRLVNIEMPGEAAEHFARGMPSLEALLATPTGDWSQGARAVFPRVTKARLEMCGPEFVRRVNIPQLMPSLEALKIQVTSDEFECDLTGATSLTRLFFAARNTGFGATRPLHPLVCGALQSLPRLRELDATLTVAQAGELGRLTALEVLSAGVIYEPGTAQDAAVGHEAAPGSFDLCPALAAAARAPRLRALRLWCAGVVALFCHGALAQLVASPQGCLAELEVWLPAIRLHDVALLAALRGLTHLSVRVIREDEGLLGEHVSQHARRGLRIDGISCSLFADAFADMGTRYD